LDPKNIIASADRALREIALAAGQASNVDDIRTLFAGLPQPVQDGIRRKIASRGATSAQSVIDSGEFLLYADTSDIQDFVRVHPALFFDGKFWAQPYLSLDYGNPEVNHEARTRVAERYGAYLTDAIWLASQTPRDLDRCDREELIRATLSVRLLAQDSQN
jgi:hypothetical protein